MSDDATELRCGAASKRDDERHCGKRFGLPPGPHHEFEYLGVVRRWPPKPDGTLYLRCDDCGAVNRWRILQPASVSPSVLDGKRNTV